MIQCPFCRGEALTHIDPSAGLWFVRCGYCEVKTRLFHTKDQAEEFWSCRDRRGEPAKQPKKPAVRRPRKPRVITRPPVTQDALEMLKESQAFGVFGTVACQLSGWQP